MRLPFSPSPGPVKARRQIPPEARQLAVDHEMCIIGLDRPGVGSSTPYRYANVLDRGYVLRDDAGHAVRFIGAMVDITAQIQVAEAAARAAQEERQRLARDLHEAVTQSLYSASLMAEAARRHSSTGRACAVCPLTR